MTNHARIIDGRTIELPAEIGARLGLEAGNTISFEFRDGALVFAGPAQHDDAAPRATTASLVDELIAERRAAFEAEEANAAAYRG